MVTEIYLCHTCHRRLCKTQCPARSIKNGLSIDEIPTALTLSELESVLIAKNILFLKLFKLPKTRWAGIRDKLVNVPINDNDLLKTLSNLTKLPRGPDDAGLLPVKLKRKVDYKNFVFEAYIDPTKLVKAVKMLKELGHPGYADVTINKSFAGQVKSTFDNLTIDGHENSNKTCVQNETKTSENIQDKGNGGLYDANETDQDEDNISKFKFKGKMSYLMDNDHPKITL